MRAEFGCQSMVEPIRRLLLAHPSDVFRSREHVERSWAEQGFVAAPDFAQACRQYDAFLALLEASVPEIHYLPGDERSGLDAIYVHDSVIVTDRGAVLCRMANRAREHEPVAVGAFLPAIGVPVLGAIAPPGLLEGGDVLWIGPRSLAVGEGYRTNAEGIRQLRTLLGDAVDDVQSVQLPHWRGPASCLHLMSFISLIDRDLALVYPPLMPVPFRQSLLERGFTLVEVPDEELETLGCNVLALSPRRCVMLDGNPRTRARLEAAGATVHAFQGSEICIKGEGGPTCLTRPLLRA